MKKVTIITVCMNAVLTIERTIKSVIEQTYGMENIEYIIIDGKSTDGTVEIVERYKEFLKDFVSEKDQGIYDAMNKGLQLASGVIVGILNADDWYEKDAIEKVVDYAQKNKECDLIYGNIRSWYQDGSSCLSRPGSLEELWYHMTIRHPATFVKRELYDRYGCFDNRYRIAADYDFVLRCYAAGAKFSYLDEILTNFSMEGVSSTKHLALAKEKCKICAKYEKVVPNREVLNYENKYSLWRGYFLEFLENNPQKILNILEDYSYKEIVIWGTGIWGKRILEVLLQNKYNVSYLLDNNEKKYGKEIMGKRVFSPSVLMDDRKKLVISAITRKNDEIRMQLNDLGYGSGSYLLIDEWMELVAKSYEMDTL